MTATPRICWAGAIASAVLVAATLGCGGGGGNTARLQGTVTIEGQALPADATGSVTFAPTQAGQAGAVSVPIESGSYDSPNTPRGAVRATFSITQPTGPEYTSDRGTTTRDEVQLVPPQYGSGIELQVADDNSEQDFDLTKY